MGTNGEMQIVDITVQPVTSPEAMRGMVMVVFTDVAKTASGKDVGLDSAGNES